MTGPVAVHPPLEARQYSALWGWLGLRCESKDAALTESEIDRV